jgi:hypothetical protein
MRYAFQVSFVFSLSGNVIEFLPGRKMKGLKRNTSTPDNTKVKYRNSLSVYPPSFLDPSWNHQFVRLLYSAEFLHKMLVCWTSMQKPSAKRRIIMIFLHNCYGPSG